MECFRHTAAFLLFLLLGLQVVKAQNYSLNNGFSNGQTITTCAGTFYDSNISGNYGVSEDYTVTFSPGIANRAMQLNFTQIALANGDTLFVYDGNSTNASLLTSFANVSAFFSSIINASDTNSTGCITVRFKSDGSIQSTGWVASIKCGYACKQKILGSINTSPNKDTNGFTNICLNDGGKVVFDLQSQYPDNDLLYHQADTSTYFHWHFGDGKDTLKKGLTQVNHTYLQEGGYKVKVTMVDSNGCMNKLSILSPIKTGIKPVFKIAAIPNLCLGDTTKISPSVGFNPTTGGSITTLTGSFFSLPVSGDSLFLPDQQNNTGYKSNIFIDQFAPGQTLTNINDLKGIFMNMEHSYLGDLDITITAPNGTVVSLKNYPGGGGCYLGEPVKEPTANSPFVNIAGKGYEYQFSATPLHGTMSAESAMFTYSFIDNAGQPANNKKYLPAGNYASANSLLPLVGTPLNGTWTLKIQDHLAVDNGFLFNWHLEFNPAIYPNVETFNVPVSSQNWVTPNVGIEQVAGTIATVIPKTAGANNFVYRVTDGFGCIFDTTIVIQGRALPIKPNLGADILTCNGQATPLTVTTVDNTASYSWSNGQTGTTQISVNNSGNYSVTATSPFNCVSRDTVVVSISNPMSASLGNDTFYCVSKPNVLKPIVSSNVTSYLWNNGSTADTLKIGVPGTYWVKCGNSLNNCTVTSTIIVADNPVNKFVLPNDTIICAGSSYTLTIPQPPSTNIIWSDGVTGNTRPIANAATYSAIANNIGCINKDTFIVAVQAMPVVDLGNDTLFCASKPNTIKLKVNSNIINYLWNDNSMADTLKITGPGKYWVKGSANGCFATDTIVVGNNPVNDFVMPNDTTICSGTNYSLTLPSIANTGMVWNDGITGATHLITGPASYAVTANNIGCLKTASFNVPTKPTPVVNLGKDTLYCLTKPNTLKLFIGKDIVDYLWSNGSTADTLNIAGSGTYWVRGTNNGCTASDTIVVGDNPANLFAVPNDTTICDRNSYVLSLPAINNTSVLWNDAATGYTRLITGPQTYTAVANSIGCLKTGSFTVFTKPLPIVSLGRDTLLCNTQGLPVKVSYPSAAFTWNTGSTDTSLLIKSQGLYWVEGSLNQCTFRDSIMVKYRKCECETIIPNAFSPNNDGINDLFLPKMECVPMGYQMSIFNRYGQPVFETKDHQKPWDGKKNGQPLPVATYYYIITYYNSGLLMPERYSGSITILR